MKKNLFFIIILLFFNKSYQQKETEKKDWKTIRDQLVSSIQSIITMIKVTNYEIYENYKEYFDKTETLLAQIKEIDTIEDFSKKFKELISNEFIKKIIEYIPQEYKDYYDKLLKYYNQIIDYYNKNKKFIDDFFQGNNEFIEEQKKIIDKGTVERNKGNYDVDNLINLGIVETLMFAFIIVILIILIYIGRGYFERIKLEKNIKNKLFEIQNNEIKKKEINPIEEIIDNKEIKINNDKEENKEIVNEEINHNNFLNEPLIQELGDLGVN